MISNWEMFWIFVALVAIAYSMPRGGREVQCRCRCCGRRRCHR